MPARIGIIGAGQMGLLHLQTFRRVGAEVVAVAETDPQQGEKVAAEFNVRWFQDYQEMLREGSLDAVSICTPPHLHAPMLERCLERGLPVLCEKPMAANLEQAQAMLQASRAHNAPFMVGFFHRFHEPLQELDKLLGQGKFGGIRRIHVSLAVQADLEGRQAWKHRDRERAGGGSLVNTGSHGFDMIRFLAGDAKAVWATTRRWDPRFVLDEFAMAVFELDGGAVGSIEVWDGAPYSRYSLVLTGEKGEARVEWDPPALLYRDFSEPGWTEHPIASRTRLDRIDRGIAHFLESIRSPEPSYAVDQDDGWKAMVAIDACYRSDRDGAWVPF